MPRRKPNKQRRDTKVSGLGYEFRDELQSALARVRDNSLLYAAESGTIRIAPLHQFSYSLDKTCVGSCLALSLKGKKISDIFLDSTKTQLPTQFLDSPLNLVGNQIRSLAKISGPVSYACSCWPENRRICATRLLELVRGCWKREWQKPPKTTLWITSWSA
jgi:hypothetical protein